MGYDEQSNRFPLERLKQRGPVGARLCGRSPTNRLELHSNRSKDVVTALPPTGVVRIMALPRAGLPELAIAVGSFLITFLICEFAIRHLALSDKMGWTMVPPLESRVLHAESTPRQNPRIIVVGDSQTEWRDSSGQSYVRVAERDLAERGMPVQFVNLAQAGTDMDRYFGNLLKYIDRLKPDLIVVGLYLGNDIHGSKPPLSTAEGREQSLLASTANSDESVSVKQVLKKSVLLNFIFRLSKKYFPQLRSGFLENIIAQLKSRTDRDDQFVEARLRRADPTLVEAARADIINPWLLATAVFYPNYYADLAIVSSGTEIVSSGTEMESNLKEALRDFASIADFCNARRIPVVAVLIPPPVWVSQAYQSFFRRLGYENFGPTSGNVPMIEQLQQGLAQLNVLTINPLNDLRSTPDEVYFPGDDHLNRRGHEVVGAVLAHSLYNLVAPRKQAGMADKEGRSQ
jgi:hypothetical protein